MDDARSVMTPVETDAEGAMHQRASLPLARYLGAADYQPDAAGTQPKLPDLGMGRAARSLTGIVSRCRASALICTESSIDCGYDRAHHCSRHLARRFVAISSEPSRWHFERYPLSDV